MKHEAAPPPRRPGAQVPRRRAAWISVLVLLALGVGDYVTGVGRGALGWPPSGGVVGEAVAGHGVAVAGGPGPGFHFPNGFAPGASFCNDQARSPGLHF